MVKYFIEIVTQHTQCATYVKCKTDAKEGDIIEVAELASLPAVASHEPMFAGSVVLNKITILFKVIFSLNDSASLLWMVETWVDGFLFIILKITVHKSLVIYSV